ncbi:uncharacterized protein BXZ73DRAFT_48924 [Epithele typhae]|uniref:uncharacterized protein n=1 Tax=Epithele typhae TaxID=378194 RepID=UPI002007D1CD|nr:uncharacterized protein BXZ73DRAFT_48924 [Epithele typhae]KAH9927451.1 hypothetical protein BXZ73DRAFT_48924 [Epithele typhae]
MSIVTQAVDSTAPTLSEEYVQECFHSYLKSSLMHAKAEGLLDEETLSSAEADLMITGPALCLYFAALRSTTNPPSVPLPRRQKHGTSGPPTDLSLNNCPPTFRQFLIVWSQVVPSIQALIPSHQHDLARVICGFEPVSSPLNPRLNGIAADLRAVAIEISMRRTFQERYAVDLQSALDSGAPRTPGSGKKASFVPPPSYEDASPQSSAPPSPRPNTSTLAPHSPRSSVPPSPQPHFLSPNSPPARLTVLPSSRTHSRTPSASSVSSLGSTHSRDSEPFSPTILADAPGIEFIRETLYAALADVLERKPHIRALLARDPTRAYFAAVALAITDVASSSATRADPTQKVLEDMLAPGAPRHGDEPILRGVLGQMLALSDCPAPLRPFMAELCALGTELHAMEERDSEATVEALSAGEAPPAPRLERVYEILERGIGYAHREEDVGRRSQDGSEQMRRRRGSTEGRAVAFANRINALALGMTKLQAFKQRQDMVFKVLAGVGS